MGPRFARQMGIGLTDVVRAKRDSTPIMTNQLIQSVFACVYSRFYVDENRCSGSDFLGLLDRFLDSADHVERLLRQVVVLAIDDAFEAADRVFQGDILTG